MVQEFRKIIFTASELASAFAAYGRTTPNFMPAGNPVSCVLVEEGVKIKVATVRDGVTQEVELVYRGLDVTRPLILFCIENNIMLPRDGRKGFQIIEGSAVLTVDLDLDTDLPMTVAPLLGSQLRQMKPVGHQVKTAPAKH